MTVREYAPAGPNTYDDVFFEPGHKESQAARIFIAENAGNKAKNNAGGIITTEDALVRKLGYSSIASLYTDPRGWVPMSPVVMEAVVQARHIEYPPVNSETIDLKQVIAARALNAVMGQTAAGGNPDNLAIPPHDNEWLARMIETGIMMHERRYDTNATMDERYLLKLRKPFRILQKDERGEREVAQVISWEEKSTNSIFTIFADTDPYSTTKQQVDIYDVTKGRWRYRIAPGTQRGEALLAVPLSSHRKFTNQYQPTVAGRPWLRFSTLVIDRDSPEGYELPYITQELPERKAQENELNAKRWVGKYDITTVIPYSTETRSDPKKIAILEYLRDNKLKKILDVKVNVGENRMSLREIAAKLGDPSTPLDEQRVLDEVWDLQHSALIDEFVHLMDARDTEKFTMQELFDQIKTTLLLKKKPINLLHTALYLKGFETMYDVGRKIARYKRTPEFVRTGHLPPLQTNEEKRDMEAALYMEGVIKDLLFSLDPNRVNPLEMEDTQGTAIALPPPRPGTRPLGTVTTALPRLTPAEGNRQPTEAEQLLAEFRARSDIPPEEYQGRSVHTLHLKALKYGVAIGDAAARKQPPTRTERSVNPSSTPTYDGQIQSPIDPRDAAFLATLDNPVPITPARGADLSSVPMSDSVGASAAQRIMSNQKALSTATLEALRIQQEHEAALARQKEEVSGLHETVQFLTDKLTQVEAFLHNPSLQLSKRERKKWTKTQKTIATLVVAMLFTTPPAYRAASAEAYEREQSPLTVAIDRSLRELSWIGSNSLRELSWIGSNSLSELSWIGGINTNLINDGAEIDVSTAEQAAWAETRDALIKDPNAVISVSPMDKHILERIGVDNKMTRYDDLAGPLDNITLDVGTWALVADTYQSSLANDGTYLPEGIFQVHSPIDLKSKDPQKPATYGVRINGGVVGSNLYELSSVPHFDPAAKNIDLATLGKTLFDSSKPNKGLKRAIVIPVTYDDKGNFQLPKELTVAGTSDTIRLMHAKKEGITPGQGKGGLLYLIPIDPPGNGFTADRWEKPEDKPAPRDIYTRKTP